MTRFVYRYRDSQNAVCSGVVLAASREDAFRQLKGKGVRPMCVDVAPGVLNHVKSLGKRWMVIAVLSLVLIAVAAILLFQISDRRAAEMFEDRSQIYGDPVVVSTITDGAAIFEDKGELWLSQFAIPGREVSVTNSVDVDVLRKSLHHAIKFANTDYAEVLKFKRIVNGIKRELSQYVADGGSIEGYVRRLRMRQDTEIGIYRRIKDELAGELDADVWRRRNVELRSLGLPMIQRPLARDEENDGMMKIPR